MTKTLKDFLAPLQSTEQVVWGLVWFWVGVCWFFFSLDATQKKNNEKIPNTNIIFPYCSTQTFPF